LTSAGDYVELHTAALPARIFSIYLKLKRDFAL
jgi:hypothetical protein